MALSKDCNELVHGSLWLLGEQTIREDLSRSRRPGGGHYRCPSKGPSGLDRAGNNVQDEKDGQKYFEGRLGRVC